MTARRLAVVTGILQILIAISAQAADRRVFRTASLPTTASNSIALTPVPAPTAPADQVQLQAILDSVSRLERRVEELQTGVPLAEVAQLPRSPSATAPVAPQVFSNAAAQVELAVRDMQLMSSVRKALSEDYIQSIETYNAAVSGGKQVGVEIAPITDLRYFTLYTVPPERRVEVFQALVFWINSLTRRPSFVHPEPVPNSQGLLYRVYLGDLDWTYQAWEKVAIEDPYFREPLIASDLAANMRKYGGNAVVRADWFCQHTSDTTVSQAYYNLLYAKAQIPETYGDFLKLWGVDLKAVEELKLAKGMIVDEGDSIVAWHNRILIRKPAATGYFWHTLDTKQGGGNRDYIDNPLPSKEFDAGEAIASTPNGLQAYLLFNAAGKRVEFADPEIARDTSAKHSSLVRTGQSCAICHAAGINSARSMTDYVRSGMLERFEKKPETARRLEDLYLSNVERYMARDQDDYAAAIHACNGLTPEENAQGFSRTVNSYQDKLTLTQCALEIGTTPTQLKAAVGLGTKGRLGILAVTQNASSPVVPRDAWEQGLYAEALLLLEHFKGELKTLAPPVQEVPAVIPTPGTY